MLAFCLKKKCDGCWALACNSKGVYLHYNCRCVRLTAACPKHEHEIDGMACLAPNRAAQQLMSSINLCMHCWPCALAPCVRPHTFQGSLMHTSQPSPGKLGRKTTKQLLLSLTPQVAPTAWVPAASLQGHRAPKVKLAAMGGRHNTTTYQPVQQ